jgi:hypothetical protein
MTAPAALARPATRLRAVCFMGLSMIAFAAMMVGAIHPAASLARAKEAGTMVPVEAMRRAVQVASLASPLRYSMDCLLGIFLKGSGWRLLWPQVAAMAGLGAGVLALGVWRLGRRL